MDAFFSRVERLIKMLLKPDAKWDRRRTDSSYSEAWAELEEYLRTGEEQSQATDDAAAGRRESTGRRERPLAVAQDYHNLELEPGADFDTVKKAYRRLMRTYHPDRYTHDLERQQLATEISSKLNTSFNRIREASET